MGSTRVEAGYRLQGTLLGGLIVPQVSQSPLPDPLEPVQLGKAATVALLVPGRDQRVACLYPDTSGQLDVLPRGGLVLRASGLRGGAAADVVTLDPSGVRAISFGYLPRRGRALRPWKPEADRPTRVGQLVRGRCDLVLVLADRGGDHGEALWAFELWRAPARSEKAAMQRLAASPLWPPAVEAVVAPRLYRRLIRSAREGGEDPRSVWPGW